MEIALLFISLAIVLGFVYQAHRPNGWRTPAMLLALHSLVISIVAANHLFEDEQALPPPILFALLAELAWVVFSYRAGGVVAGSAGIRALLGISIARIPV